MSRLALPLLVPDASQFARALGTSLKTRHASGSPPPGHVELLNMMARALGHRNLQSLQAGVPLTPALPQPPLALEDRPAPPALSANARKALMQFDSRGRLLRWPTKYSVQTLAMWLLWTLFDGRRVYTEKEVNEVLKAANALWRPRDAAPRTHQPPADEPQERLHRLPQTARTARRRDPRADPGLAAAAAQRVASPAPAPSRLKRA